MHSTEACNLAEYISEVNTIIEAWTPVDADWYLHPWFRGHGNCTWQLQPGLYRFNNTADRTGDAYYDEGNLMRIFKLRAPTFLEHIPSNDWEWLFLMQHYGLPTRLLDWTESSLIALYFALRDHQGKDDACVWVLSPWWLNKQTFKDYLLFSADHPNARQHQPLLPGEQLKPLLPIAITPVYKSSRIVAQRGVFTIHGTNTHALDQLSAKKGKTSPLLRQIRIPQKSIPSIKRDLAVSGITESLIFPELSGLCNEIKREFFGL